MAAIVRWWHSVVDWFKSLFWKQEMELTLVGLQNSGKTTLVNVLSVCPHTTPPTHRENHPTTVSRSHTDSQRTQSGSFQEDMIPTVGFNMKKVTKGNVTIKMWDIGGQTRFRSMWERYCRGVNAIVYVVDSADKEKFELSKKELHELLAKPPLAGIPLLVLGNKNDLPEAVSVEELIDTLFVSLPTLTRHRCCCCSRGHMSSSHCFRRFPCPQQRPEGARGPRGVLLLDLGQEQREHRDHAPVAHQALEVGLHGVGRLRRPPCTTSPRQGG